MLAHLPGERLQGLASAHPARSFPASEILLRQGDPAKRLLVLLDGQATAVTDRALQHLARTGLIRTRPREIVILDPVRLHPNTR